MPIYVVLAGYVARFGQENVILIHGAAPGADACADKAGEQLGIKRLPFPAEWDRYKPTQPGRKNPAGPIRNRQMLHEGQPDVVWAFHEDPCLGSGTKDMVEIAQAAGVPCYRVISSQLDDVQ